MTRQVRKSVLTFIFTSIAALSLAGCIIHVGASKATAKISFDDDYTSVNKSLNIGEGKTIGDASSVNGTLTLQDNITAKDVSTVNGRLKVGKNVSLEELSTVNGKLSAGAKLNAKGDVSSVNGKISLDKESTVGGSVSSVNGKIELDGVDVLNNIQTVSGSVVLSGDTHVAGNIVFEHRKTYGSFNNRNPILRIDKDVKIEGDIILESPVDLEFDDENLHKKVVSNY